MASAMDEEVFKSESGEEVDAPREAPPPPTRPVREEGEDSSRSDSRHSSSEDVFASMEPEPWPLPAPAAEDQDPQAQETRRPPQAAAAAAPPRYKAVHTDPDGADSATTAPPDEEEKERDIAAGDLEFQEKERRAYRLDSDDYLVKYGRRIYSGIALVGDKPPRFYAEYRCKQDGWYEAGLLVGEICGEKQLSDYRAYCNWNRRKIYEMVIATLDFKTPLENRLEKVDFYSSLNRHLRDEHGIVLVGALQFMLTNGQLKDPMQQWQGRYFSLSSVLGNEPRERLKIELLIQELSEILRRNKRYFSAYWSAPGFGPLWNCVCNEVVNPCRYVMEARIRAIRDKGYYQPIHARINRLHPEPHEKEAILQTLIECSHLQLSRERPYEEQLQKLEKTFWVETEPEDYLLMFTYDCEAALTESELVQDGHIVLQDRYVTDVCEKLQPSVKHENTHVAVTHGNEPGLVSQLLHVMHAEGNRKSKITVFGVQELEKFRETLKSHHCDLDRVDLWEDSFLVANSLRQEVLMDVEAILVNPPSSKQMVTNVVRNALKDSTHRTFLETIRNIVPSLKYCSTDEKATIIHQKEVLKAAIQLPMIKDIVYCTQSKSTMENENIVDGVMSSMRGKKTCYLRSFYEWKTEETDKDKTISEVGEPANPGTLNPTEEGDHEECKEQAEGGKDKDTSASVLPAQPSEESSAAAQPPKAEAKATSSKPKERKKPPLLRRLSSTSSSIKSKVTKLTGSTKVKAQRSSLKKEKTIKKKAKVELDEKYANMADFENGGVEGGQMELQAFPTARGLAAYCRNGGLSKMKLIHESPWANGWFCAVLKRMNVVLKARETASETLARAQKKGLLANITMTASKPKPKPEAPKPPVPKFSMDPGEVMKRAVNHHTKHTRRLAYARSDFGIAASLGGSDDAMGRSQDINPEWTAPKQLPKIGVTPLNQPMALQSSNVPMTGPDVETFLPDMQGQWVPEGARAKPKTFLPPLEPSDNRASLTRKDEPASMPQGRIQQRERRASTSGQAPLGQLKRNKVTSKSARVKQDAPRDLLAQLGTFPQNPMHAAQAMPIPGLSRRSTVLSHSQPVTLLQTKAKEGQETNPKLLSPLLQNYTRSPARYPRRSVGSLDPSPSGSLASSSGLSAGGGGGGGGVFGVPRRVRRQVSRENVIEQILPVKIPLDANPPVIKKKRR